MRRPAKLSLITGASYFSFSIAVWYLVRLLGLSGSDLWILRGGLWFLGGTAAGLILWYLIRSRKGKPEDETPDELAGKERSCEKLS